MDLFDRKIIGWPMSNTMTARATVIPALKISLKARPINQNELIFHSDRGVQYASDELRRMLARYHINQSMSRKANCCDNAVTESFLKILKSELIYQIAEQTMDKTKVEIFKVIEISYNKKRKYFYLNYLTPAQFGRKTKSVVA